MKKMTLYDKSQRSFSCTKLELVISSLEESFIPASSVLTKTGLSRQDLMDHSTIISLEQVLRCYKNAIQLTKDNFLGYKLGFKTHTPALGMLGFALLSATNIRQALKFAEEFYTLTSIAAVLTFKENQHDATWTINPVVSIEVDPDLYKFLSQYYVSGIYTIMLELIGDQFALESISYPYAKPETSERYTSQFNCQIHYNATEVIIKFDKYWLDFHNTKGNDAAFCRIKNYCQKQSNELFLNQGVAGLIRKLYLNEPIQNLTIKGVCAQLNMSERTLRRRLQEEQTSFRQVIDDARKELALEYLKNSQLGIEVIAFQLGYSCSFTFRQAVHRWTGMAPSQIRTQNT